MMLDLVGAVALGLGLGVITGMPLGVINVAIVDAVLTNERRHALGLGIGGALADATHTLLAFAGLGRLVTSRPELARWLAIAAAIVIVAFAISSWRRRLGPGNPNRDDASQGAPASPPATEIGVGRGVVSGIALTLPNPAALAAWVAVAAMTWPDASIAVAIAMATGVGIGSAAWFAALARIVARVRPDHRALRILPKLALAMFVAIALVGVLRAL